MGVEGVAVTVAVEGTLGVVDGVPLVVEDTTVDGEGVGDGLGQVVAAGRSTVRVRLPLAWGA